MAEILRHGGNDRQPSQNTPAKILTLAPVDVDFLHARLDDVCHRLDKLAEQQEKSTPKLLLNREQAAEALAVSVSTLDGLRRSGELPAVYVDANPRWSVDDLKSLISSRRRTGAVRRRQPRKDVKSG